MRSVMKTIILLSGGLDSLVILALAKERSLDIETLTFDYNQRHKIEIERAQKIAAHYSVPWNLVHMDTSIFQKSTSSLIHHNTLLEEERTVSEIGSGSCPSAYVPGRNTLFLAYALSLAESLHASEIHIGANAADAAGFADTRPLYFAAFQNLIKSLSLNELTLVTPLIHYSKKEVIDLGRKLNAPLDLSISCYQPKNGIPCGKCDACVLRISG